MSKTNFTKLTKVERANTYGGLFLELLPAATMLLSTVVTAGIAIYHAVSKSGGSVSFGGSKTITEKPAPVSHAGTPGIANSSKSTHLSSTKHVRSFTAY